MTLLPSLFGTRLQALLGVDIGSSAVKVLQLGRRGRGYGVEACAVEPMPANAMADDGQIPDPERVADVVRRAVARAGTGVRDVALAMPTTLVIDKRINLAAGLREADMEEQIRAEADQHISFPLAEVDLDFTRLGKAQGDAASAEVLLVACRKEHVEARVAAAEIAGLHVRVVDVETYALAGSSEILRDQLPDFGVGHTVAVIDLGAVTLSMLVLHDGVWAYSHDQAFGGHQLTSEIARVCGVTPEEAERIKCGEALPEAVTTEVLPRFYDDFAQQIQRAMQYYYANPGTARDAVIDVIVLAGGSARIPHLAEAVTERLKLPVQLAEPFRGMSMAARVHGRQVQGDGPALLVAAGLALRAFDETD